MLNSLKQKVPSFLHDVFYDLAILALSHLFYQLISGLLH